MTAKDAHDCGNPKCLDPTHQIIYSPVESLFVCTRCGMSAEAPSILSRDIAEHFRAFARMHIDCAPPRTAS